MSLETATAPSPPSSPTGSAPTSELGAKRPRETALYAPVKAFLEAQGYEVKAEVASADVVACREGDDDPVIVELKTGFTLSLLHQAVERLAITDAVYVAVPTGKGRQALSQLRSNTRLCRRLGLGLLTVRLADGRVTAQCDPGPYQPRQSKPRRNRLLREFARREGDPNVGGSTRVGIMTAYRQDAIKLRSLLLNDGPQKAAIAAERTGVDRARRIMADDHYGWFERVERGVYGLTPKGRAAHKAGEKEADEKQTATV